MKSKVSKMLLGVSFLIFASSFFVPVKAIIKEDEKKRVWLNNCFDDNDNLVGHGNSCITGAGSCIANDCP